MKKMRIILWGILIVIGLLVIYESSEYSPVKNEFNEKKEQILKCDRRRAQGNFSEKELQDYPQTLKKYFEYTNIINKPKMKYSIAKFEKVDFLLNKDKKSLKIDYERINDGTNPNVLAFIDSSFFGIPFQGIDSYYNEKGSMKGVLGKHITLFDEYGEDFYTGSLVTYLSECLIIPSAVFQEYITWKEIDSKTLHAELKYGDYNVSGLFHFKENGELEKFTSNDRVAIDPSGKVTKAPWTAKFLDYYEENGMKHPGRLQAIWHYKDGDSTYFDGKMVSLTYGY